MTTQKLIDAIAEYDKDGWNLEDGTLAVLANAAKAHLADLTQPSGDVGEALRDLEHIFHYESPYYISSFKEPRLSDKSMNTIKRALSQKPDAGLDIIHELSASFDKQTYKEKLRGDDNFDAPDDKEYCVNITAKQLRDIDKAAARAEQKGQDND